MKKWNLIVHVGRCINCRNCAIADRDEHVGNDFPGYAASASPSSESTIRILRRDRGSAPMVDTTYLPVMCNHCDDAPCLRVGGGAVRKRDDGIVVLDPVAARGRRDIAEACPYGAIGWDDENDRPQAWIFDAHLLDQGWTRPRCAQVCPTDVFEAVALDDAAMALRARREALRVLRPELGTRPRVWYRDLDRWEVDFVGGSVAVETETGIDCVADARITLRRDAREIAEVRSDAFGDFCFDGLRLGDDEIEISVDHPLGVARLALRPTESVNLGEIRLRPAGADRGGER